MRLERITPATSVTPSLHTFEEALRLTQEKLLIFYYVANLFS